MQAAVDAREAQEQAILEGGGMTMAHGGMSVGGMAQGGMSVGGGAGGGSVGPPGGLGSPGPLEFGLPSPGRWGGR